MSLRALLTSVLLLGSATSMPFSWAADSDNGKTDPPASSSDETSEQEADSSPATPLPAGTIVTSPTEEPAARVPALPSRDILAESAIRYGSFQAEVSRYNRIFNSQDDIAEASEALGGYNPNNLASGWIAYSALLASESDTYAEEIRKIEAHYGHDRLMTGLQNSVTYSLTLDGSQDALNQALSASKADSRRLKRIGEGIISQSRGKLQTLGWAKAKLRGDSDKFVEQLRLASLSGRPVSGNVRTLFAASRVNEAISNANTLGSGSSLWDSMSAVSPEFRLPTLSASGFSTYKPFANRNRDYDFINGRIVTLAAYRILGETDESTLELTRALTDQEYPGGITDCIDTAQLEYRGCLVGNHFVFERAFCIGEHAVTDVGRCIEKVSK